MRRCVCGGSNAVFQDISLICHEMFTIPRMDYVLEFENEQF